MDSGALAWAEIDLGAIGHNVRELRRISRPPARLMAVVKANAYGHGHVQVAREALQNGAGFLGVARIAEAIALRREGIDAPLLIFGDTPRERMKEIPEWDLRQTLWSAEKARQLSESLCSMGKTARIHIKCDSGMGRLGLPAFPEENLKQTVREISQIMRMPGLECEGIFTHFAASDSRDLSYARLQTERFLHLLECLRGRGMEFPIRHAANSAAIIALPESHLDMVRAGISLYGLPPSDEMNLQNIRLRPAMRLKSRIIHLKKVDKDFCVSYGMTYKTPEPTRIATVALGYADGYSRLLSNRGRMLVHGKAAPVIGRVCMDLTMLDVGHIPDAAVGDEVLAFGDNALSAGEIASLLGTINYEVVSSLTSRVKRIYKHPSC